MKIKSLKLETPMTKRHKQTKQDRETWAAVRQQPVGPKVHKNV